MGGLRGVTHPARFPRMHYRFWSIITVVNVNCNEILWRIWLSRKHESSCFRRVSSNFWRRLGKVSFAFCVKIARVVKHPNHLPFPSKTGTWNLKCVNKNRNQPVFRTWHSSTSSVISQIRRERVFSGTLSWRAIRHMQTGIECLLRNFVAREVLPIWPNSKDPWGILWGKHSANMRRYKPQISNRV